MDEVEAPALIGERRRQSFVLVLPEQDEQSSAAEPLSHSRILMRECGQPGRLRHLRPSVSAFQALDVGPDMPLLRQSSVTTAPASASAGCR